MLAGVLWLRGPGNVHSLSFSAPRGDIGGENRYISLYSTAVLNLQRVNLLMIIHICKRLLHKKHFNHSEHLVAGSLTQTPGKTFHLELN